MAESKESSETYFRLSKSLQASYAKTLIDRIEIAKDSHVLEIGCGTGATAAYLAKEVVQNGAVTACDPEENRVRVAIENYAGIEGLNFIKGTGIEALEGKEHVYDVIYSNSVLHWMSNEDFEETMRMSFVAMKSGGIAAHNVTEMVPENYLKIVENTSAENLKKLHEIIKPISLEKLVAVSKKVGFKVLDSGRIPTETKVEDLKAYLQLLDSSFFCKFGIEDGYMKNKDKIDLKKDENGKVIHVTPLAFVVLKKA